MTVEISAISKANALLDQLVDLHEELKDLRKEVNILEGSTRQLFVEAVQLYKSTGMGDFEVSELVREYLRKKIPDTSLRRYLEELKPAEDEQEPEDEIEDSSIENPPKSDLAEIDDKNDIEQPSEIAVTTGGEEVIETPNQSEEPITEDPKDLEIQFLKEKVTELEDALKKTEQFKPATQFQELDKATSTNKLDIKQYKEPGFEFLREMADGVHSFYYDTYGIDLFRNRELPQLKNSGVKVFRRLYFEV